MFKSIIFTLNTYIYQIPTYTWYFDDIVVLITIIYLIFQLGVCPKQDCISTVGVRIDLFHRDLAKVPITDFFGSVRPVELTFDFLDISNTPL